MTTITLELSPEQEQQLRRNVRQRDTEAVRRLLVDALQPAVEALFQDASETATDAEWEAMVEQLIEFVAAKLPSDAAPLSDHAVSRKGIYEDHP